MKRTLLFVLSITLIVCSVLFFASCKDDKEYRLNFVVDGKIIETVKEKRGETILKPVDPIKQGYTFDGWFWDNNVWQEKLDESSLDIDDIKDEMSVYAKFSEICNFSQGLEYQYDSGAQNYYVIGIGTCSDSEIVIPSKYNDKKVSGIGDRAFKEVAFIKKVVIPDSIRVINQFAFDRCTSLEKVEMGEGVTDIRDNAFAHCESLVSIAFPKGVKSIGDMVFAGCKNLENIELSDNISSIGENSFSSCDKLKFNEYGNACYLGNINNPYIVLFKACSKEITQCNINSKCRIIYEDAFNDCRNLKNVDVPNSVTIVGERAFYYCTSIVYVTIANKVEKIGVHAFAYCSSIVSVIIGDGKSEIESSFLGTDIDTECFANCTALRYVKMKKEISGMGWYVFKNCQNLTEIFFMGKIEDWQKKSKYSILPTSVPSNCTIHCTDGDLVIQEQ